MILVTSFLANLIFMMYRSRFGDYDFNDMEIGTEILLPHGVHFVKTDKNKYGIKWYAYDMRDWEIFRGAMELRLAEIIDDNIQIHPDLSPKIKDNGDGSGSFVGKLVGMGL